MKCGDLRCGKCGRNALESRGWLQRVGKHGDPDAAFECRPACEGTGALSNEQRLLGALEAPDEAKRGDCSGCGSTAQSCAALTMPALKCCPDCSHAKRGGA